MTDLTSIGTLFAFVLVSAGVLMLPKLPADSKRSFRLPYFNGKFIVPLLFLLFVYFFRGRVSQTFTNISDNSLQDILFLVFVLVAAFISILTFIKNFSLIPILGVLFCSYLLIEIPAISWIWFFVWMALGLIIYFMYGYRKSKLREEM